MRGAFYFVICDQNTHYFYALLGVRYEGLPVEGWELNHVPVCMYLLAHPYFCTYHVLSSMLLRRVVRFAGDRGGSVSVWIVYAMAVCVTSYITAWLEAWSISAYRPTFAFLICFKYA